VKPILLVSNPSSAKGRSKPILEQALVWLKKNGVTTEQLISQQAGHLFEALPPLLKEDWRAIAVLGGDGTLFEVVNIYLESGGRAPLAVIPGGTGNSFAKEFAGHKLEDYLLRLTTGAPQPVDVAHCRFDRKDGVGRAWNSDAFYFINVLGTGFTAEVNRRSFDFKRFGMFGYVIGVLATLAKLRPYQMRLMIDGQVIEKPNTFVTVCNSRITGGNMLIAPDASIRDGWLDVLVVNAISRWELLKTFPKVFSGKHTSHPEVELFRAKRLRLETDPPSLLTPDGETLGTTPIEIEMLPGKLQFLA